MYQRRGGVALVVSCWNVLLILHCRVIAYPRYDDEDCMRLSIDTNAQRKISITGGKLTGTGCVWCRQSLLIGINGGDASKLKTMVM